MGKPYKQTIFVVSLLFLQVKKVKMMDPDIENDLGDEASQLIVNSDDEAYFDEACQEAATREEYLQDQKVQTISNYLSLSLLTLPPLLSLLPLLLSPSPSPTPSLTFLFFTTFSLLSLFLIFSPYQDPSPSSSLSPSPSSLRSDRWETVSIFAKNYLCHIKYSWWWMVVKEVLGARCWLCLCLGIGNVVVVVGIFCEDFSYKLSEKMSAWFSVIYIIFLLSVVIIAPTTHNPPKIKALMVNYVKTSLNVKLLTGMIIVYGIYFNENCVRFYTFVHSYVLFSFALVFFSRKYNYPKYLVVMGLYGVSAMIMATVNQNIPCKSERTSLESLYPFFTLFIFGEVFFSAFITFLDWWAFTKEKNNFFDFGWFGDVFYVKKEESE